MYIFLFGTTVFLMNVVEGTTLNYGGNTNATLHPANFRDSFAMAHQTLSTIGYGHIAPSTDWTHIAVFTYGAFGLILNSLLVAVIWSRVTAVRPVVAFTTKAVISKWNGKLALRFKIAGLWRPKPILTGQVSVNVVLTAQQESGVSFFRTANLPLEIEYNPLMVLPWTVVHIIGKWYFFSLVRYRLYLYLF